MESAAVSGERGEGADAGLWRSLFDLHPDPLMFLTCEHRVVRVNAAQAQALGCRPEEVVGRFCFEVMHGSTGLADSCPHACMVRERRAHSAEVMVERLGGFFQVTVQPVFDAQGRQVGVLHVARAQADAGAGAAGSQAARAQELRNRLFFNRLLVMMIRRLSPNILGADFLEMIRLELQRLAETLGFGRCVLWQAEGGAALRAVARYECAEARLPPLEDAVTRERAPLLFAAAEQGGFMRASEGGIARCATGQLGAASDGPSFLLLVECPERAPGSAFLFEDALRLMGEFFSGLLRHAADAADKLDLSQRLVQADRTARLGQLTASLAHELNQPLAATLCNAQAAVRLLAQEQPDVQAALAALDDIEGAVRRAGTIIRHTRALFTGTPVRHQPVDLNRVVGSVLGLARGDAALPGATFSTRLHAALPPVLGDETQLQQVVRNLLTNACDAVGERPEGERAISIRTGITAGGSVELCVQDSGLGILEGMEEKIFAPFYTTKPEGQGMGLAICRQIVERHGGTIRAARAAGAGNLFRIILPAAQT